MKRRWLAAPTQLPLKREKNKNIQILKSKEIRGLDGGKES